MTAVLIWIIQSPRIIFALKILFFLKTNAIFCPWGEIIVVYLSLCVQCGETSQQKADCPAHLVEVIQENSLNILICFGNKQIDLIQLAEIFTFLKNIFTFNTRLNCWDGYFCGAGIIKAVIKAVIAVSAGRHSAIGDVTEPQPAVNLRFS